jgi:hypothetical protein
MTLYEALDALVEYAEANQLSPAVLGEVLGGEVMGVYDVGGEMAVKISYPGWELLLRHRRGFMVATIRGDQSSSLSQVPVVINVSEHPMTFKAFVRVMDAALRAKRQKEVRP